MHNFFSVKGVVDDLGQAIHARDSPAKSGS